MKMSIVPVSTPLPLGVTVGERLSGTALLQDNHFSITICCKNWWGGFSFCFGRCCCCLTKAWLSSVSDLLLGYQPNFRMSTCKVTANSIGDLEKRGPVLNMLKHLWLWLSLWCSFSFPLKSHDPFAGYILTSYFWYWIIFIKIKSGNKRETCDLDFIAHTFNKSIFL